jgi:hypothetical protein
MAGTTMLDLKSKRRRGWPSVKDESAEALCDRVSPAYLEWITKAAVMEPALDFQHDGPGGIARYAAANRNPATA